MARLKLAAVGVSAACISSCVGGEDWHRPEQPQPADEAEFFSESRHPLAAHETNEPSESQLVALSNEPASTHCAFGGTKLVSGVDRDGNRRLQDAEILNLSYICTTRSEVVGKVAGSRPRTLVNTKREAPSAACPDTGGVRIDIGHDDNGSGALETLEVTRTTYLCGAPCVLENERLVVPASVAANVEYGPGIDPSELSATTTATSDSVAWLGFDFGDALLDRAVVSLRLHVRSGRLGAQGDGDPILRVLEGSPALFAPDGPTPTNMPRQWFVSDPISWVAHDGWNEIPIRLEHGAFASGPGPRRFALGVDEVTVPNRVVSFYGVKDPATRPYLEFETLRCESADQ